MITTVAVLQFGWHSIQAEFVMQNSKCVKPGDVGNFFVSLSCLHLWQAI
jgi:hypothetical protein